MHWRTKARIQQAVAALPTNLSGATYYAMQLYLGGLQPKALNPTSRMRFGIEICEAIQATGNTTIDKRFFEIGTGWRVNMPLVFWLCGASRITTVDLNRFLKVPLVRRDIEFVKQQGQSLREEFESRVPDLFDASRWEQLLNMDIKSVEDIENQISIQYSAPADATAVDFDAHSFDYHVSCNTFEHIPQEVLRKILIEANRIVQPEGLLLHRVDHTDHFSHFDKTISPINFLQYDDGAWSKLASNRFAYVNRLREDDYLQLFAEADQEVHRTVSQVDPEVQKELSSGFPLVEEFKTKSQDSLARLTSLFVASPASVAVAMS